MNIINLYEDLKKYIDTTQYDDMFYEATEGEAQKDIIKEILEEIIKKL